MFNKKEKELEDNITHSTVKLLLEKFKFLSLKSKISLVGGISICVITIIFSIVLAFVLPNSEWPIVTQTKWLKAVEIIRWIGIGVVSVGLICTFIDIFKKALPDAFENGKKAQKPAKRKTAKKPAKK